MTNFLLKQILIFSCLLITACATSGHHYLKIKAPEFGAQFVRGQVNTVLEKSGFKSIDFTTHVTDTNAGANDTLNQRTGKVLESESRMFMRYQHQAYPDLLINVTIKTDDGAVKLEIYETDKKELTAQGFNIYNQVKENIKDYLYDDSDMSES